MKIDLLKNKNVFTDTSIKNDVTERFLRYVKIDTESSEESGTHPSTMTQFELARCLVNELKDMGIEDVYLDEQKCYVYGSLPGNREADRVIGFIAHMDTAPAVSGHQVKPRIVEQYEGSKILLNSEKQIYLDPFDYPSLNDYIGQTLITTDGTTLLGADDKAGVAEIMGMLQFFVSHPEEAHGTIRFAFTPDEEIGEGSDGFDLDRFSADYGYTVDGGAWGEIEYENFNAASGKLIVHGQNVHPGSAKGIMKNAILIAQEFQQMLPTAQNPMYTEGYEGFFHLDSIRGNVEETVCDYIIRDFDEVLFARKKALFEEVASFLNQKYGDGTVEAIVQDSYYNMMEKIKPHMHLTDRAKEAMQQLGKEAKVVPIRGGTDGARLSFMGLPCPNLCAGGENFHSRFEYISIESMEKITKMLIILAKMF